MRETVRYLFKIQSDILMMMHRKMMLLVFLLRAQGKAVLLCVQRDLR